MNPNIHKSCINHFDSNITDKQLSFESKALKNIPNILYKLSKILHNDKDTIKYIQNSSNIQIGMQ